MSFDQNDYEKLEQELLSGGYQALLQRLRTVEPFFRKFTSWMDVIAFMRKGTSEDPQKDEVLRPIFRAHYQDQEPRWRTILLVIFWPGLKSIHWQKRHWDQNPEELWQNIIWVFLKIICRIDVSKRPSRLVQKVFNDTVHHLYDEYRYQRRWKKHETAGLEELDALGVYCEGVELNAIEQQIKLKREIKKLKRYLSEGVINETDCDLILGTRLYGLTVKEYSQELGLDYQTAKKRRQRAEAKIRHYEKKS